MTRARRQPRAMGALLRWAIVAIAVAAMLPISPENAGAQGTATITVRSFFEDGSTPLPFARFQVTASDGAVYGPRESTPPDGEVTFTVEVGDETIFTIEEETPPACGIAPEPQTVGPLEDGEELSVEFATAFLADCDLGSISLYHFDCPAGTDADATDYAAFSAACAEPIDGTTFAIREAEGDQNWDVVTGAYGIAGRAPLVGLVPGDYRVAEQDGGDRTSVAFCFGFAGTPATPADPELVLQETLGEGGLTLSVDGNRIACDVFRLPGDEGDEGETPAEEEPVDDGEDEGEGTVEEGGATARVEIHLAACAPGYDIENPDNDPFADCHGEGLAGQTVSINGPDGFENAMETVLLDTPGPGVAAFENLAAGWYHVAEDVPGDTVSYYVFCLDAATDEPVEFRYDDARDEGIDIRLAEGINVVCDWYIVPEAQGDEGEQGDDGQDVSEADAATARVEIHLAACPPGYDMEDPDNDPFADCHGEGLAGQVVSIEGPDDYAGALETVLLQSPGPGIAAFENLPAGVYHIAEDVPGDTVSYYVFCSNGETDESVEFRYDDSQDEGIDIRLAEGINVVCDWYIVPDRQTEPAGEEPVITVQVTKYTCAPGYQPGGDQYGDFDCDEATDGVAFTLARRGGETQQATTGDSGAGELRFEATEPGTYDLSEELPGDVVSRFAFCGVDGADLTPANLDDGLATFTFEGDAAVECVWFNVPAPPAPQFAETTFAVTAYTCAPGYEAGRNVADFAADCTQATNGVPFALVERGGDSRQATTGDSGEGEARFAVTTPGVYDLSETPPAGTATQVAFCGVDGGDLTPADLGDGLATFDIDGSGRAVVCAWFNIPEDPDPPQPGSLRIHKSVCPGGQASDFYATCYDETLAGVTFDVAGPGGYANAAPTGDDGTVQFDDLAPGDYTVTEVPPGNVAVNMYVVVCTREGETYAFTYDDSTGLRINLRIPEGALVVCDWYNVPPAPKPAVGGSITVIKFLCEGKQDNDYDWDEECDSYGGGAEFALTSVAKDTSTAGTTGTDGRVVFSGLANGAYGLDETSGDWCRAEADRVDANGNVRVENGGNTNVYVYNCSKRVRTLPATGSGPLGAGDPAGGAALHLLAGGVGVLGLVGLRRRTTMRPAPAMVRRSG